MNILEESQLENQEIRRDYLKRDNYKIFRIMTKNVNEVTEIKLEILKRDPLVLVISCKGNVISNSWTNGQLIPFVYVRPPSDGIYEFDFVATEPTDESIPVQTDIRAQTFFWEDYPSDLGGVKIYAMSNMMVEEL